MPIGDERGAWSSPDSVPEDLAPGTVLGGYRIEGVAGRGGMGIVYRATQLSLGRIVALKVIDPVLAADPGFRRRFQDESALAASLDHPNVVTVHEAGEEGGRLYVSMRLVPGMDLGRLVGAEGPLDPRRAVHLVAGVAGALDAAHAAGLVHRDVKPSNVLVERRADGEHAILSDFGVVKRTGADAERTGSAGWVGSADFVAPEQVLGGPVDGRSDIYALGAVLYTALTGRVPFERPDLPAKLYASVNEAVPP
ncbi:MAG: serine/threonine protein kinase, partial [Acidimicrobiaceae bacterium]|nr:serine/threonine protein kinase [Acidimicrobiaceae bacterium]